MILSFIQNFPWGGQTYFDLKIAKGLIDNGIVKENYTILIPGHIKQKIHTIREDKKDRWNSYRIIHMFYNARQKGMRPIAPVVPCVSTQKVRIEYTGKQGVEIYIDDNIFYSQSKHGMTNVIHRDRMQILSHNDGFDSTEDFFRWFDKDFKGKIIHWTNFKY